MQSMDSWTRTGAVACNLWHIGRQYAVDGPYDRSPQATRSQGPKAE